MCISRVPVLRNDCQAMEEARAEANEEEIIQVVYLHTVKV